MMPYLDIDRIAATRDALLSCSPQNRLLALQNLCENNGVWTIPQDSSRYSPVLYEISLFGVAAIADDVQRLPDNWLRACANILQEFPPTRPSTAGRAPYQRHDTFASGLSLNQSGTTLARSYHKAAPLRGERA